MFLYLSLPLSTAKSLQSCPTVCDPMECSQPGSSVHGILQARILEWVTVPSSRGSSRPRDWNPAFWVFLHWQAGSLPLVPPEKPYLLLYTAFKDGMKCYTGAIRCSHRKRVATAPKGGDPWARGWGLVTSGLQAQLLHLRQGKLGETPAFCPPWEWSQQPHTAASQGTEK